MATLKSIKNKYLTNSDGAVLGVTTNTENISALSFKLATADSLSKFNLVDGFSDDYNDATGVDSTASANDYRDSTDKYYKGLSAVTTSGWDSQITDGLYTVEVFSDGGPAGTGNSNPATYVTDTAQSTEYLVVGGGGAGGGHGGGGGGGGGGVLTGTVSLAAGSYAIVVGATSTAGGGGYGGSSNSWKGNDSSFNDGSTTYTAGGGQGGAGGGQTPENNPVASGGGGSGVAGGSTGWNPGGSNGPQGGHGAMGYRPGNSNTGGGGGGSSGGGAQDGSASSGGPGGPGTASSITGSSVSYGGGGGGGSHGDTNPYSGGSGGSGGGGAGAPRGTGPGTNGTANSGGGGGGAGGTAGQQSGDGGTGGSGVVYLRHLTSGAPGPMTLQSTAFTAQAQPTTARILIDEWAYTGAQTLNTDIKAYVSRDNGTTFTQATLASQGYLLNEGGINGNTQTMLHMDGADGGTTFTDSCTEGGNTAKTWTASGNAHTSTDQFKFGTAAAYFDGTGDYISTPATADFNFGSDPFTIDFWMRASALNARVCGDLNSGGSLNSWEFILNSSGIINFGCSTIGVAVNGPGTLSVNTWYHIAVTRVGNVFTVYVNGTGGSTHSVAGSLNANQITSIGRSGEYNAMLYNGYIDEFRITPGVAVWTSNFTPPVQEYKTSRRILSGSVDVSGQPSGTSMKYKIETLNQAAAKQTRVYATSMAWA